MGEKLSVKLDPRTLQGKKVAQLRNEGIIPAVVYGPGIDPINVQIAENVMDKLYRQAGTHSAVNLNIDGKRKIAMIKEVDRDPVRGSIRHVSFHAVKANEPVVAEVPIHLIGEGESEAERNGLVILQNLEKIEVRALPMNLPDAIEISIVDLKEAGERVTLAAATLPEGVVFVEHDSGHDNESNDDDEKLTVADLQVASVWEPAALQAANETPEDDRDASDVDSDNGEAAEAVNEDTESAEAKKSD